MFNPWAVQSDSCIVYIHVVLQLLLAVNQCKSSQYHKSRKNQLICLCLAMLWLCVVRCTMKQLGLSLSEGDVHAMMRSVAVGPHGKISYPGISRTVWIMLKLPLCVSVCVCISSLHFCGLQKYFVLIVDFCRIFHLGIKRPLGTEVEVIKGISTVFNINLLLIIISSLWFVSCCVDMWYFYMTVLLHKIEIICSLNIWLLKLK